MIDISKIVLILFLRIYSFQIIRIVDKKFIILLQFANDFSFFYNKKINPYL